MYVDRVDLIDHVLDKVAVMMVLGGWGCDLLEGMHGFTKEKKRTNPPKVV